MDFNPYLGDGGSRKPGMVRISLGAYTTADDIDALVEMLRRIARGEYDADYRQLPNGDYRPAGAAAGIVSPFAD